MLVSSTAADDPEACTRFTTTVTPSADTRGSVVRAIGDVVVECVDDARRDDVVRAVGDVLSDAARQGAATVTVRVRRRTDRTEIEVLDRVGTAAGTGSLDVARASCDAVIAELTGEGRVVRLVYRSV